MQDLIAKLEEASAPSKDLDTLIAYAIGWTRGDLKEHVDIGTYFEWISPQGVCHDILGSACHSPNNLYFTASIDAALTLVPKETDWSVGTRDREAWGIKNNEPDIFWADMTSRLPINHKNYFRIDTAAVSPAIALCIAALKARVIG